MARTGLWTNAACVGQGSRIERMIESDRAAHAAGPGGVLHACLDGVDLAAVDGQARLDVLVDYERCAAQLAARQYEALALLDPGDRGSGDDWAREDVAAALGIAPGTARNRLAVARTLYRRLTATWRLLRDGRLGAPHARGASGCRRRAPADRRPGHHDRGVGAAQT